MYINSKTQKAPACGRGLQESVKPLERYKHLKCDFDKALYLGSKGPEFVPPLVLSQVCGGENCSSLPIPRGSFVGISKEDGTFVDKQ